MHRATSLNDTTADHERLERTLLARDRDARDASTADLDDATARALVGELLDADDVVPVPDERLLVHEPSGAAFESITQLAVFHRGWRAGREEAGCNER